jgi:EAL domain-containing protein (putative c-di-GMP-specific phosphodiesterase class I)
VSAVELSEPGAERLAAQLGEAIERRRLQLYYQPIVSLLDRVAREVEALPRWPRDEGEILAPSDFIEVAEKYELLGSLESWAIETAFEQLGGWRRATDVDISLNLSEDHVYASDLPGEIRSSAQRHGVDPRRLTLEVSETAVVEAGQERLQKLQALVDTGVGLMLDDYSGAVEADQLAALPTTALKISRRIVAGIPDVPRSTEVAAAALRLADDLGLRVIANGVESPGQLAALRDMGCEYGQGFLFSVPMPADVLAERALPR